MSEPNKQSALSSVYSEKFWESRDDVAIESARTCVRIIHEVLGSKSIVDVGCGRGHWLKVFMEAGVTDVRGADGTWVRENSSLLIPEELFFECDLSKPFNLKRKFDLAMSLEVAEHLPPASAEPFVRCLTEHADVVLFSAAIPGQGGVGHLNERWSWYWKAEFEKRDFIQYDPFRWRLWHDKSVALWYRQNMFLYIKRGAAKHLHDSLSQYRDSDLTLIPSVAFYELTRAAFWKRAIQRLRGRN